MQKGHVEMKRMHFANAKLNPRFRIVGGDVAHRGCEPDAAPEAPRQRQGSAAPREYR
jgi:hypothetical protein